VRLGRVLTCEARDADVIVVGYGDAPIPWPIGQRRGRGARALVVYGGLAGAREALRRSRDAAASPAPTAASSRAGGSGAVSGGPATTLTSAVPASSSCTVIGVPSQHDALGQAHALDAPGGLDHAPQRHVPYLARPAVAQADRDAEVRGRERGPRRRPGGEPAGGRLEHGEGDAGVTCEVLPAGDIRVVPG
jgi:hypothetical protein